MNYEEVLADLFECEIESLVEADEIDEDEESDILLVREAARPLLAELDDEPLYVAEVEGAHIVAGARQAFLIGPDGTYAKSLSGDEPEVEEEDLDEKCKTKSGKKAKKKMMKDEYESYPDEDRFTIEAVDSSTTEDENYLKLDDGNLLLVEVGQKHSCHGCGKFASNFPSCADSVAVAKKYSGEQLEKWIKDSMKTNTCGFFKGLGESLEEEESVACAPPVAEGLSVDYGSVVIRLNKYDFIKYPMREPGEVDKSHTNEAQEAAEDALILAAISAKPAFMKAVRESLKANTTLTKYGLTVRESEVMAELETALVEEVTGRIAAGGGSQAVPKDVIEEMNLFDEAHKELDYETAIVHAQKIIEVLELDESLIPIPSIGKDPKIPHDVGPGTKGRKGKSASGPKLDSEEPGDAEGLAEGFSKATDGWFDALSDKPSKDPAVAALLKIAKGKPSEEAFKKFSAGVRKIKDKKVAKLLAAFVKAVEDGKYSKEFAKKVGPHSQVSELFSLFRQSATYSESTEGDNPSDFSPAGLGEAVPGKARYWVYKFDAASNKGERVGSDNNLKKALGILKAKGGAGGWVFDRQTKQKLGLKGNVIEALQKFSMKECPECGSKVPTNTGYCMKCKKKTLKTEGVDEAVFKKGRRVAWTAPNGTKMQGVVVNDVGIKYDIKVRVTNPKPKKGDEEVLVKRAKLKTTGPAESLVEAGSGMTMTMKGREIKEPTFMKKLAKKAGVAVKRALRLWGKAQFAAEDQYPDVEKKSSRYYQIVTGIFKKMLGISEHLDMDAWLADLSDGDWTAIVEQGSEEPDDDDDGDDDDDEDDDDDDDEKPAKRGYPKTAVAATKQSKSAVNYQPQSKTKKCKTCSFWLGGGECSQVKGKISAEGTSDLWQKKVKAESANKRSMRFSITETDYKLVRKFMDLAEGVGLDFDTPVRLRGAKLEFDVPEEVGRKIKPFMEGVGVSVRTLQE